LLRCQQKHLTAQEARRYSCDKNKDLAAEALNKGNAPLLYHEEQESEPADKKKGRKRKKKDDEEQEPDPAGKKKSKKQKKSRKTFVKGMLRMTRKISAEKRFYRIVK
jgi:hypothetical protein